MIKEKGKGVPKKLGCTSKNYFICQYLVEEAVALSSIQTHCYSKQPFNWPLLAILILIFLLTCLGVYFCYRCFRRPQKPVEVEIAVDNERVELKVADADTRVVTEEAEEVVKELEESQLGPALSVKPIVMAPVKPP